MVSTLTAERLRELVHYDPETGVFTWLRCARKMKANRTAGTLTDQGYVVIGIEGQRYGAHRLAWLYVTGEWPKAEIDHRNRTTDDNRFVNLREADRSQNRVNSRAKSPFGLKGIDFRPEKKKPFCARIMYNGKNHFLGYYSTPEEAHEAYQRKALEIHGEFAERPS